MSRPGLAALLEPRKVADFRPCLEAGETFVVDATRGVGALTRLPFLQSLAALLGTWPYPVQAHLPKIADEASAIDVPAADARKLFDNGIALMFDHAERLAPELSTWLAAIRADLSFSAMTQSRCLIYATPDGKGTAPHFDQNANFVLQLHGKKTWCLAPNSHVVHPLSRHTMGLPADPELASYSELPLPEGMPDVTLQIELTPGSLLFVPAGVWHSTKAEGEALSLNFTFHAPAWLDLFTSALRSRLALSPEWRATAHGVGGRATKDAARERFDALLAELVDDLPHWNAADILDATEG